MCTCTQFFIFLSPSGPEVQLAADDIDLNIGGDKNSIGSRCGSGGRAREENCREMPCGSLRAIG